MHMHGPQVFNKCDVTRHEFACEWMADFETYHTALDRDSTYAATLSRSLSLVRCATYWQGCCPCARFLLHGAARFSCCDCRPGNKVNPVMVAENELHHAAENGRMSSLAPS